MFAVLSVIFTVDVEVDLALVAFVTVVPAITVPKAVPFTVIALASLSISASPLISRLVACPVPLVLNITLSPPSTSNWV